MQIYLTYGQFLRNHNHPVRIRIVHWWFMVCISYTGKVLLGKGNLVHNF